MICAQCREALQGVASIGKVWTVALKDLPEQDDDDESVQQSRDIYITHHPTYRSFREALDQRCSICIALWESLEPEDKHLLETTTWPDKNSDWAGELGGGTRFSSPGLSGEPDWINIYFNSTSFDPLVLVLEPLNGVILPYHGDYPHRLRRQVPATTPSRSQTIPDPPKR
jgi:hypothetical protein